MRLFKSVVFFVFFSFVIGFNVSAQISPGELSNVHISLDDPNMCSKCHISGTKSTRAKCLECHKEIQAAINSKKGFHASAEVKGKECAVCHSDHHGRDFKIIVFDKKAFNHASSGFELKGVHAKKDCNACHKPAFIKDPELKKRPNSFLGLKSECLTCHADYHQGKLSPNCATCHNFNSFKKATGFDHSKTHFPLLGKHATVACLDCHKTEIVNGKKTQKFTGLVFDKCTACHKDVHENKFGQNCQLCHSEESFHFNKNMKAFDHDKTDFKLIGKHKLVECKICHKNKMTDPIKHDQCQSCHPDFHKKEFAVKGVSPDCNTCHTNNGFSPSTFTVEKHNSTKFPLLDAHFATPCLACHKVQKVFKFKNIGTNCVDCHKNEHKGFIEEKFFPNESCASCHNVRKWNKVNFDHNKTDFKLDGAHSKITCGACHYARNDQGIRTQKFDGLSKDCVGCHKDVHVGQFIVDGKNNCTQCHTTENWKKTNFDHATSRFKLDGAHAKVTCIECHKAVSDAKGNYIQYKFEDIACKTCHK